MSGIIIYIAWWSEKYPSKRRFIKHDCSWCDKLIVLRTWTHKRKYFYVSKRYIIRMSQNFLEMFESSGGNKIVELDLSSNLTKVNLKEAIAVDTWNNELEIMNEVFSTRVNLCNIQQSNVFQTHIPGLNSKPCKTNQAKANQELTF